MKKRIAALMITTIFALTGAGCSQNDPSGVSQLVGGHAYGVVHFPRGI